MCFSMGLISEMQYHNLNRIRKIRNRFAHSHDPIDWKDKEVSKWSRVIELPKPIDESGKPIPPEAGGFFSYELAPRVRFITATLLTYTQIVLSAMATKKADSPGSTRNARTVIAR
jgi:hypothetical protein